MSKYFGDKNFWEVPVGLKLGFLFYSFAFFCGFLIFVYAIYSWFARIF